MILCQIQKQYCDLTPAERKIAEFILASPQKATAMTVHQLAAQCKVASSAVTRFCKSIGLKGFSQLKLSLAREQGSHTEDAQLPAFQENDEVGQVIRKVFSSSVQTLQDTLALTDSDTIGRMADTLMSAKRIFLFGIGTSAVIASDAQYRLSQLGLWAVACTDIVQMNITALNLEPGDAVIAISHSGQTKAVVDAVRNARQAGATTLAVTSFADSLLYRESHLAACVFADEIQYPIEAVSARLAHICLLDALTMILATRNFDSFAAHMKARNLILDEIRYSKGEHT